MKITDRGVRSRTKVRFKRAWRGYRAGDVIVPPAALRDALLVQTVLGKPIIEVVEEPIAQAPAEPQDESATEETTEGEAHSNDEPDPRRRRRRGQK